MQPKTVRPIPISPTARVQSVTPMPQVRRSNIVRPMAHSPPPFEAPSPPIRSFVNDESYNQSNQMQHPTNISLLSRGISLLSITQLRDLLRDYSLPTGGNKHVLVNRLIIFLETFGQNQQNLLVQFSTKLKRLLSVEAEDHSPSNSPQNDETTPPSQPQFPSLPPEIAAQFGSNSPSCLYEPTEIPNPFGPHLIQPGTSFPFLLSSQGSTFTPILQVQSGYPGSVISRIVLSINNVYINLRFPALWAELKDFIDRPGTIHFATVEPATPIVVAIRWMKIVTVPQLCNIVSFRDPAPKMPLNNAQKPNGVCPLTRKIIARPSRGVGCMHGECFDLSGFICYAMKNNAWQCPICRKPLQAEELRIDPYYFAIASGAQ